MGRARPAQDEKQLCKGRDLRSKGLVSMCLLDDVDVPRPARRFSGAGKVKTRRDAGRGHHHQRCAAQCVGLATYGVWVVAARVRRHEWLLFERVYLTAPVCVSGLRADDAARLMLLRRRSSGLIWWHHDDGISAGREWAHLLLMAIRWASFAALCAASIWRCRSCSANSAMARPLQAHTFPVTTPQSQPGIQNTLIAPRAN